MKYIVKDAGKYRFKIRKGTWDENVVRAVAMNNEYGILPNKGDLVVDIGAHIGTFSIPCAQRGARVIAFEPSKESYDLLLENAKLNGVKIDARNQGIGDGTKCHLKTNAMNMGSSKLADEGEEVEITQLNINEPIDILKIDCEGCEYDLEIPNARFIVGELHGERSLEFVSKLKKMRYTVKLVNSNAKDCKIVYAQK